MTSEIGNKKEVTPLRATVSNLNESLVTLQDIYEDLDGTLIEFNGEVNPFEYYDPEEDQEGIRGLSKEIASKVNFLKQGLTN